MIKSPMPFRPFPGKGLAIKVLAVYLVIGGLWIFIFDPLVKPFVADPASEDVVLLLLNATLFLFVIRYYLAALRRYERDLLHQAFHDSLTGLPNREMFCGGLQKAIDEVEEGSPLAVLYFDLDRFKTIIRTLGHGLGDRLLCDVVDRLKVSLQPTEILARIAGDEFLLLLPDLERPESAAKRAERLLESLNLSFDLVEHEFHVTASVGIAVYPRDGEDVESLVKNADNALRLAKKAGRNKYRFYAPEMNAHSLRLLGLEHHLCRALDRDELVLNYQPQFDLESDRIIGLEALVRWNHPERGWIAPGEFVPLAEEVGLIVAIGKWVLRTACRQNKSWQEAGLPPVRVAVNISALQFAQTDLAEFVAETLEETGLDPSWLELEITESVIIQDIETTVDQLISLMDLGIQISIDDFGTGYSSLSYLKKFPIHALKIDRSFVKDLGRDPDSAVIVNTVIAMANSLNLELVAEGVESDDQLRFLRSNQCSKIQGNLLSRPLPAEKLEALLKEYSPGPSNSGKT